jgi:hypothetical protein
MIGQVGLIRAVCIHDENFIVAISDCRECNSCSVRTPCRFGVGICVVRDSCLIRSERVHHIDFLVSIAAGSECNSRAVRVFASIESIHGNGAHALLVLATLRINE